MGILQLGENKIEIKVTNTLIGLLEGKTFDDYDTHTLRNVNELLWTHNNVKIEKQEHENLAEAIKWNNI